MDIVLEIVVKLLVTLIIGLMWQGIIHVYYVPKLNVLHVTILLNVLHVWWDIISKSILCTEPLESVYQIVETTSGKASLTEKLKEENARTV